MEWAIPKELFRQLRTGPPPIDIIVTEKNPIRSGISFDIEVISSAVFQAVMGIGLTP
jgi:hypothetical protein